MSYQSKNIMPRWMEDPKYKLNEGRDYKSYFDKERWHKIKNSHHFTGLRKDRENKI
jgi:hypothetical protein